MTHGSQPRRGLIIGIVLLIVASLACSLGGSATSPTTLPPDTTQLTVPPIALATETPTLPAPTATSAPPTETPPTGKGPDGCELVEQYVADVTIPDNTILSPGAAFVKTWRVKNAGTCTWDTGYQLIFATGNQMGGPAGVNVNLTAPGNTVDISVNLTAPTTPGTYSGKWSMRANNGAIFGGVTVVIIVPATPTPTPSLTPEPTASSGIWNGHWESNCGATNCGAMDLVQTGSVVTGTYAVGSGTPGSINGTASGNRLTGTWSRGGNAGSFDWWMGGTGAKWRGNYNATFGWCGHRTGDTDPTTCDVGTFAGAWNAVCEGCDGAMSISQDGRNFTGTYVNGTLNGTIDGTTATGTWHTDANTGTFTWYLINSQQFNGNYGGTHPWCGYRSGSGAPSPCLKP